MLRDARGRGARALRHRGSARRGGAPHAAQGGRGPGRRHRRHRQAAGPRRRAVACRLCLPPGDRRGNLSLADGRADPARRPRARRARGAEPHAAQLHRGRERDAADGGHGAGRARGERRAGEPGRTAALERHRPAADAARRRQAQCRPRRRRRAAARAAHRHPPGGGRGPAGRARAPVRGGGRNAERDRRAARGQRHRRRRRASRHPRELSHVRRRPRLATAHDRRGAQRPHRRGGGAEGPGRDACA